MTARLYGLDVLRGLAAVLVVVHHLQWTYSNHFMPIAAISAVDLFLVISGFVMARTYDRKLVKGLSALSFVRLRYRRLAPCMGVGALFGFLLFNDGSLNAIVALLATFAFMPMPYFGGIYTINIPTWSLFVEIISNAAHKFLSGKTIYIVLVLCCLAFIPPTLAAGKTYWGSDFVSLGISTARGLACYILGIIVFRRFGDRPIGNPYLAIAGLPVLLIVGGGLPDGLFAVAFIALSPFIVRAALGFPYPAHLVGGLSFPLYAIHLPAMQMSKAFGGSMWLALGSVAVSTALLYYLLEKRRLRNPIAVTAEVLPEPPRMR